MMAILGFSAHFKRPHYNPFFFKKKLPSLNLILSNFVILFSAHVNNQVKFYVIFIQLDLGKQQQFCVQQVVLKYMWKSPIF